MRSQHGTTLIEVCVAILLVSALAAVALPSLRLATERARARSAIQEASALFSIARRQAITRRAFVAVSIDTARGSIVVRAGGRVLAREPLGARYGVRLAASRDSMAYDPRGLGFGAANLSLVARRGRAAETLLVSRLGRTRR